MITYQTMTVAMAEKFIEIDRSETISKIFTIKEGVLEEKEMHEECPGWDENELKQIRERYVFELTNGGMAVGAFQGDVLVGFGVLGHQFRGADKDQLQVDLMYVSRKFRKQGIGSHILDMIGTEAKARGASYLYISATETAATVSFYMRNGGNIAGVVDEELFQKEPQDIHLIKKL